MINENSVFAGELSGHYYFQQNIKDNLCYFDCGQLAMITILNLVSSEERPQLIC